MLDGMSGSGTEEDPYQITSLDQLRAVGEDLSAHYELVCDINAQETSCWDNKFNPLSSSINPFTGTFNGNNYEIINLYISQTDSDEVGLFGCNKGRIENIGLAGANVTGRNCVGGLVGYNGFESIVESSYVKGDVSGNRQVGGLVGHNDGKVALSYQKADVSTEDSADDNVGKDLDTYKKESAVFRNMSVGGLVGRNWGTVESSYVVYDRPMSLKINKLDLDSSFLFTSLDRDNTPEDCDLLISMERYELSYIVDTNTLYLDLDNKKYSCSGVSSAKVNKLAQRLDKEIVEISDVFRASIVAT